jgi:hypothetical protein
MADKDCTATPDGFDGICTRELIDIEMAFERVFDQTVFHAIDLIACFHDCFGCKVEYCLR